MTSAFGWLSDLIRTVAKIIPRLVLVRATYSAAVYRRDGTIVVRDPGLFWYWPVTTDIRRVPRTLRTHHGGRVVLDYETVTPWEVPVSIRTSLLVNWRVVDVDAFVRVQDVSAFVRGAMRTAALDSWRLESEPEPFRALVEEALTDRLAKHGMKLELCTVGGVYRQIDLGVADEYSLEVHTDADVEG